MEGKCTSYQVELYLPQDVFFSKLMEHCPRMMEVLGKKETKENNQMLWGQSIEYLTAEEKWFFLVPGVMPSSSIRDSIFFCKTNWSLNQFSDNGPPHLWCSERYGLCEFQEWKINQTQTEHWGSEMRLFTHEDFPCEPKQETLVHQNNHPDLLCWYWSSKQNRHRARKGIQIAEHVSEQLLFSNCNWTRIGITFFYLENLKPNSFLPGEC